MSYDNDTTSYQSLMNDNVDFYGDFALTSIFSMDFRGLGLPPAIYSKFTNLINVVTNNEANCQKEKGGICTLSNSCASYPELWDYTFRIEYSYN